MKRILIAGLAALILAAGAAIWFVYSRLDSLVASAIETHGTEIVGAPVRVGSVNIDLTGGRGTIRGLRIGNPDGFSRGDALRLGEIRLDLDAGSVTETPIVINELRIAEPVARFEVDARGRSNFARLQAEMVGTF